MSHLCSCLRTEVVQQVGAHNMIRCTATFATRVLFIILLLLPALTFWIWLMKEAIRTAHQCPEKCWCSAADTTVDCTNASLKDIPKGLSKKIKRFTISHNNISILRKNQFLDAGLNDLETLTLRYNGIFSIKPGAFNELSKLSNLYLQNNNLSTLKTGIFSNLTNLSSLHMTKNKISNITFEVFSDLGKLISLNLEDNEIKELHEKMFIGLSNLKNLWLGDNMLTFLDPDVFQHIPKLNSISLNNNKALFVPTYRSFLNVPTLTRYVLSECNIKNLSAKSFEMSPNITYLGIENNSISTIHINMLQSLPQLKDLQIFENPLECDCRLKEVWQWCHKHDVITGYGDKVPLCRGPEEVSGLWWGVLGKAQCSNEHIEYQEDYKSVVYNYIPYNPEFEQFLSFMTYVESSVFAILFLVGAVGNITVLIIIGCNRRMRTIPNTYIFNLAAGDLSLVLSLPLLHAVNLSSEWILGDVMCKLAMFCHQLSIGISAFSVAVLSIQRHYAMSGSSHLSTKRATMFTITAVWFTACCCALPAAFSVHVEFDKFCTPYYSMEYYKMSVSFHLLVFCVIPLCVIVFMYTMTARHLVQKTQCSEDDMRRCKTLAKIVIGLVAVFFISFIPYHMLMTILAWISPSFELYIGYLYFVSQCLLVLNPCLNPISLCCTSVTFKKLFKYYLLCRCQSRSTKEDEESDLPDCQEASVHYRQELTSEVVML